MTKFPYSGPSPKDQPSLTDNYFLRSKAVVEKNGDKQVTYAVFMQRPVLSAPQLAFDWLNKMADDRGIKIDIEVNYEEGSWVGAGEPMFYLHGPLSQLIDLETVMLQRIGAASVAAYNAFSMCNSLPKVSFFAMDARHCAGTDMTELMAYGASVGSRMARKKTGAVGFIGCATDHTAPLYGLEKAKGTMPHALIGYAGSTIEAARLYYETFPEKKMTVLVDYFGQEITDALAVAQAFPEHAHEGRLALRLDTHGGRYVEGLDVQESYNVLERNAADTIRGYRNDLELKFLIGTGVSAAATWYLRENLNDAGFDKVEIVCSSGFSPEKCRVFALAEAPVDMIGTGSYLPEKWSETYATADVINYDGRFSVKKGREFLIPEEEAEDKDDS